MGEYGREQRNQLSRAIANSGAGSRQLKGFVDNRSNRLFAVCQMVIRPHEDLDGDTDATFATHKAYRSANGLAACGTPADGDTVATLDDGKGHTYTNKNAHGLGMPAGFTANAISRTHAEGGVFIMAFGTNRNVGNGKLVVDRAACGACGVRHGIKGMANSVGFSSLSVKTTLNSDAGFGF